MAAKTFQEWHKAQGWKNNNFYFVGMDCWNAATKAAEEKFTAGRTLAGVTPTTTQGSEPTEICHCKIKDAWLKYKDSIPLIKFDYCPSCGKLLPC